MLQTFPRLTVLSFWQSLGLRYILLFAIGLCAAVILPMISICVSNSVWLAGQGSVQLAQVATIDEANFSISRTHQEPNFVIAQPLSLDRLRKLAKV
jgi:hypothetical protein